MELQIHWLSVWLVVFLRVPTTQMCPSSGWGSVPHSTPSGAHLRCLSGFSDVCQEVVAHLPPVFLHAASSLDSFCSKSIGPGLSFGAGGLFVLETLTCVLLGLRAQLTGEVVSGWAPWSDSGRALPHWSFVFRSFFHWLGVFCPFPTMSLYLSGRVLFLV